MLKSKSKMFKMFVQDMDKILSAVQKDSNIEQEATKLKQICMVDQLKGGRYLMFGQDIATTLILNEIMAKSNNE